MHPRAIPLCLILLVLSAIVQSREEKSVDQSRELARSYVISHLSNARKAPRGGFLQPRLQDFGNIAVIEVSSKTGTMLPANKFDLGGKSISITRAADGSYRVQAGSSPIANAGTTPVSIAPGESKALTLPFSFPFYKSSYRTVFVHATGNITLGKPAKVPFALSEAALFHTVARVAPLDVWNLTRAVEVSIDSSSTQAVLTWRIPVEATTLRAQAVLSKTGDISFKYDAFPADTIATTGITPGPSNALPQKVDFSKASVDSVRSAVVETFTPSGGVDQVAIAKAFLAGHPDTFDMLALFFNLKHPGRPSVPGTGVDVIYQNNIRGIGREQYNFARVLGTKGHLKAIASMFDFEAYPADPHQSFPGYPPEMDRTPLELVSHEIAHYWLASPRIIENGMATKNLLSDGCCHWSFTFDADGSFMNGNDIRDNGNGTFTTTDALTRFSALDQYLMGLIPASDVPTMFYVNGSTAPADDARNNVTFSGTRVPVSVNQIISAEGPRIPASTSSQRSFRVAFILIVDEGHKPSQKDLQKLEILRAAWPEYFRTAASNRITMSSTLAD